MKKLYTILAALFLTAIAFAQAPEKMSYQAVVRDSGDALVTSQPVGMQISILQTTATGTAVYVETQTPTTNVNGLVSLEIGTGIVVSGDFTTIDWSTDSYFIKTEIDPAGGTTYTITGTSQLMSVPFALYAKTSGDGAGPIGPQGPAGNDGATGASGLDGAAGATGINGTNGLDGATGAAGTNGTNGLVGATGAAGTNGATGAAGTNGTNGLVGATGLAGATGPQGLTGAAGTNGTNGSVGATGLTGDVGVPGLAGPTGPQGLTGATGAAGTNGTNGSVGATGLTGDVGATGLAGATGPQGLTGATGAAGTNGTSGSVGATGLTGDVGAPGLAGPTGPQGLTGAAGTNGATGTNGADGATGLTGADGAAGIQGDAGANGADGTNGVQGIQGEIGPEGAQGNTGAAGAANISWSIDAGDNITNTNSGYTAITSDLNVFGFTNLNGLTNMNSDLNVLGFTYLNDLNVDGNTNLNGPTNMNSDLNVNGITVLNGAIASDLNVSGFTNLNGPTAIASDLNVGGNASGMLQPSSAAHLTRKDYVDAGNAANVVNAAILNDLIAALEARIVALEQSQPQPATVGDFRAGGIVFWVDPADNTHGLVCALSDDATQVAWGCSNTDLPNVPNVPYNGGNPVGLGAEIGDGESNTNNILNDCPIAPAALAARFLGPEWFLPSAKELNEMYIHETTLEAVSGFSAFSNFYWSSTEFDVNNAWVQNFGFGGQASTNKNGTHYVRAVRAF
jgi:hypothetical protein